MLKKRKIIALLTTTIIVVGSLGLSAYGASVTKTMQAHYGTSRIIIDGKDVTNIIEPFIVEGTTYIPLRVVANAFNKKVDWNPLTSTATITEDLTQINQHYQAEILKRDVKIMELESKVQKLEKELESKKEITLNDLQKQLNKDHDEYRDVEFDITLSGTTSKVKVKIEVNLRSFSKEWKALTESRKTAYLQEVVDDILEVYPDASIDGYIRDTDGRKDILSFTVNKKGKVSTDSVNVSDIKYLESELDDYYYDYFKGIDLHIELDGNENNITFSVYLKNNTSKINWEKLSDSSKDSFMRDICRDIEREFVRAGVIGRVYYGGSIIYRYY